MSDQIIVATFNNTNAAYDAVTAMKALKDQGLTDFKPKAGVMLKKDDRGNVVLLESKERPLWGTAVGTATGALIGLIAGARRVFLIAGSPYSRVTPIRSSWDAMVRRLAWLSCRISAATLLPSVRISSSFLARASKRM